MSKNDSVKRRLNSNREFAFSALALAIGLSAPLTNAATIEVTNAFDAGLGCTLRDAMQSINAGSDANNGCSVSGNLGENDTVTFSPSANTITISNGSIKVYSAVSINPGGSQVTISGADEQVRLFNVSTDEAVEMDRLTVRDARSLLLPDGPELFSGAIACQLGPLTIRNSILTDNTGGSIFVGALCDATIINSSLTQNNSVSGGAIAVDFAGSLNIVDSEISHNTAIIRGGAIDVQSASASLSLDNVKVLSNTVLSGSAAVGGGGIYLNGVSNASIINSQITGNSNSASGGGILATSAAFLSIRNSTISTNSARDGVGITLNSSDDFYLADSSIESNMGNGSGEDGGGINLENSDRATITRSLFADNENVYGGAIHVIASDSLSIENSTFFGNRAVSGGAILANALNGLELSSSTIASNTASSSAANIRAIGSANLNFSNSIVADAPFGDTCQSNVAITIDTATIVEGAGCSFVNFLPRNLDPGLLSLRDNGGPTKTLALRESSPAVNTGVNETCPAIDQRGLTRANSNTDSCDVGAFEVLPSDKSSSFVIPTNNGKIVIIDL